MRKLSLLPLALSAALLCLTGCQPKEEAVSFGNNAVVLEVADADNGLFVTDNREAKSPLFGDRCLIDCSSAQLIYHDDETDEITELQLNSFLPGDEVTIALTESEVKNAENGKAKAKQIQLMTQRISGAGGPPSPDAAELPDSRETAASSSQTAALPSESAAPPSQTAAPPSEAAEKSSLPAGSSPAASLEEADYRGFAAQLRDIFARKDMEALSRLCSYPVYVTTAANTEGMDVAGAAELKAQQDDIFSDAMAEAIAAVDIDTLVPSEIGVYMGNESGAPGLAFGLDEDGMLRVMAINSEVLDNH